MTREEAINYFKRSFAIGEGDDEKYHNEVLEYTIKALEQEPVIDKARAEIEKLQTYKMFIGEDTVYIERDDVLAIIDKHKGESEDKE